MHISGKILAWMAALGGLFAIYFAGQTLAIRNAWMAQAQKNEAAFLANKEQIETKTREKANRQVELARTMLGWDRFWPLAQATIRNNEVLLNPIPGVQQDQVVYVFAFNETGESRYLGDYKVVQVTDQGARARPNWFLRAGEMVEGLYNVRVRSAMPNQYTTRLGELDQQLLAAGQVVMGNELELARQGQLIAQTEKLIAGRLSEINGAPELEGKNLPAVNIKGLITGITDEEKARDAALLEADRLMRALKLARSRFEETVKANEELTKALAQPKSTETNLGAAR